MAETTGTYEINFREVERMRRLLAKYPEIASRELGAAMRDSVRHTEQIVQKLTPVYSTRLRRSIVGRVEQSIAGGQPSITGIVGTDKEYALPVELGRRPGSMPPLEPLIRWAAVVLGDGDAGPAVRWAIYRRGTKPRGMFARGWRQARGWVSKRFARALTQIVKGVADG